MSGKLILAPCGSGKSWWVKSYANPLFLDGDEILQKEGVKNRNYLWYGPYTSEQHRIIEVFERYLRKGYHILYSGNPLLMEPDLLVLTPLEERWKQLKEREGWRPTREQFEREEEVYQEASLLIPTLTNFDLLRGL